MSFPEAGRCACSGYKTELNIGSKTRIAPGFILCYFVASAIAF